MHFPPTRQTSWEMKCARCGRFYLRFIPPVADARCDCGSPWTHTGGILALDGPMPLVGEFSGDCGGPLLMQARGPIGGYDLGAPGGSVSITITVPAFTFDAGRAQSWPDKT